MSGQANQAAGLRATFATPEQMQDAVTRLTMSGFDRADISLPEEGSDTRRAAPASTEEDARQIRTLGASTAATVGALAAAGITVATGGAAAPVIAAAVLAGGAAGGATFAATGAANSAEQESREHRSRTGTLVLTVRAVTAERQSSAENILREAGASQVETVS